MSLLEDVRAVALRGDTVSCPCCRHAFRRFAEHNGRAGARCPSCGSLERHRAIWLWLERETDLFRRAQTVLHVAPERGLQSTLAGIHGDGYLSVDLHLPFAMRRMDVTRLELPDKAFDAVLCCHVLGHTSDDTAALRELRRVTRAGGWALLESRIEEDLAETVALDADPADPLPMKRRLGRDLYAMLDEAGWEHERLTYGASLTVDECERFGIFPEQKLLVAHRFS